MLRLQAYKHLVWDYKNANIYNFRQHLSDTNFDECFTSGNVDESCEKWTDKFLESAKSHIPNKTVTVRPNDSRWYTNELRLNKRKMMNHFHKYKRTKMQGDWEKYTKSRNDY